MEKKLIKEGNYYIIKFHKSEINDKWKVNNNNIRIIIDDMKTFRKNLSTLSNFNNDIKLLQLYFKRMSRNSAIKLYNLLHENINDIDIDQISDSSVALKQFNSSKFNNEEKLKSEHIKILRRDILQIESKS